MAWKKSGYKVALVHRSQTREPDWWFFCEIDHQLKLSPRKRVMEIGADLMGVRGKLGIESRPKIDTRCAVTILMDLQFQGFSCTYATKENREAFSYIVVFVVVVSLLYEKETFFYSTVAQNIFLSFKKKKKVNWEAIVNITHKDSMYIVA